VRKGLDAAQVKQIQSGLLQLTTMVQGRQLLYSLYQIDDLAPVNDAFYDPLRQVAQDAGITDFQSLFPTPVPPTPKPAATATP
jgi:ABC-type phosphate/phosphonate transport system substrate-binding protein